MTTLYEPSERRGRPPRRRRRWPRRLAFVLAVLFVFVLGLSFGKALNDGPEPGVTQTSIRTLEPLPQQPAPP